MNKKEILEVRKLLNKDNTHIDRISGCYVNAEKEKKAVFQNAFYSVPEEAMFKYSEIFRKTLSGTIGKNLSTLAFSLKEELEGENHKALCALVKSGLQQDELNERFFDRIIENYQFTGNYLIILAHGVYDIPTKTSDNIEVLDGSEYVYEFMVCSICPVNLSKPGLCFDDASKTFVEHLQDWMVQMPVSGFLFPAFQDRNTDLHSLLYYTGKPKELHTELTENVLGCQEPVSSEEQKLDFTEMVEEVFGDECSLDTVREIHDTLTRVIEEKKEDPEPEALAKEDIRAVFAECGAQAEKLEILDEHFDTEDGSSRKLMAANVLKKDALELIAPDIKIKVSADRSDLLETMEIEGRRCLVIPLEDGVEVNGIRISEK